MVDSRFESPSSCHKKEKEKKERKTTRSGRVVRWWWWWWGVGRTVEAKSGKFSSQPLNSLMERGIRGALRATPYQLVSSVIYSQFDQTLPRPPSRAMPSFLLHSLRCAGKEDSGCRLSLLRPVSCMYLQLEQGAEKGRPRRCR